LVEVITCCEAVPDCADELNCEEYCDESSDEDESSDDDAVVGVVVVAVVALAADFVAAR
jgi:hypothetical protein